MMSVVCSGTPSFFNVNHMAERGTESYAYFRSTQLKNDLALCSHDFSRSWRTEKIISVQLLEPLKPHCDSGSVPPQQDFVILFE